MQRKLAPKRIGPFQVLEAIRLQAYCLALFEKYLRLHPVFHVLHLEPFKPRNGEMAQNMPMPDLKDNNKE